jgi:aminoglycoside phosphotransferase (APT) family kinase protein
MHPDEVEISAALVRGLVASQYPQWAECVLEPIASTVTVNAIWRLGTDMYVRLPRVDRWAGHLEKELQWLPVLAPHLSLVVPEPIAAGNAQSGYPFTWAIYRWQEGETFDAASVADERGAAEDLAQFVGELRHIDTTGAPRSRRDQPLHARDAEARAAIVAAGDLIDTKAAIATWEAALRAPKWNGNLVWTHGDLLPSNALVLDGRITAIIDFGSVGVGDPAIDLIAAWSILGNEGRDAFRLAIDADDSTWARASGFALHQALLIIPYYIETNPAFVAMAQRTISELAGSTERA